MNKLKEQIEKLNNSLGEDVEVLEEVIKESEGVYSEELNTLEESKDSLKLEEISEEVKLLETLKELIEEAKNVLENKEEVEEDVEEPVEEEREDESKEVEIREENKEKRSEEKMKLDGVNIGVASKKDEGKQYREALNAYLRAGTVLEGLTTNDAGEVFLKKEEIIEDNYEVGVELTKYVNVKKVTTKEGKVVEADFNDLEPMVTVEELHESPIYKGIGYKKVEFSVETYREAIINSKELVEDMRESGGDIDKYIYRLAEQKARITKNSKIMEAINNDSDIKTIDVSTIADLVTPGIDARYRKEFILSESVYNKLARLTDSEGRFLLHNDLTKPVTQKILGKNVIVLPDEEIGADTALYGNLKDAVIFFDRKDITVKWEVYLHYGEVLQPVVRFDVKVIRPEAVVKLNVAEIEGALTDSE